MVYQFFSCLHIFDTLFPAFISNPLFQFLVHLNSWLSFLVHLLTVRFLTLSQPTIITILQSFCIYGWFSIYTISYLYPLLSYFLPKCILLFLLFGIQSVLLINHDNILVDIIVSDFKCCLLFI